MSVLPSETLETAAMTLEPSVHELLLARRQQVVGGHVDALLDVWDLEEDHPRPRPTKRRVRRRRDHVAMFEEKGVLLRGNKARDVSDVRHEDGTNLIRDGARHHRESWQGGRSTPVSASELCKSTSSSKAPRSITLPSQNQHEL